MAHPQAARAEYTRQQLEQYYDYISFPKDYRIAKDGINSDEGLSFLTRLVKYQLRRVPFENLNLHYSLHHTVAIEPDHLFTKIVGSANGRGGYCMENNLFFGTVLRSVGYQVLPLGARVSSCAGSTNEDDVAHATYSGFSHTVNLITIAGRKYFVDVGFGSRGPTGPVPLEDGFQGRSTGNDTRGGTLFQLTREHIMDNTHRGPEQQLWVYSIRFHEQMQFLPLYCFSEIEFLPQDFAVMSFYVSQSRTTFFGHTIVCQKFLLDENEDVVGDVNLFAKVIKERKFGVSRDLANIKNEQDRVRALEEHFGIKLTTSEIKGIKGLVSELTT